jgi:hypothetical protein
MGEDAGRATIGELRVHPVPASRVVVSPPPTFSFFFAMPDGSGALGLIYAARGAGGFPKFWTYNASALQGCHLDLF